MALVLRGKIEPTQWRAVKVFFVKPVACMTWVRSHGDRDRQRVFGGTNHSRTRPRSDGVDECRPERRATSKPKENVERARREHR